MEARGWAEGWRTTMNMKRTPASAILYAGPDRPGKRFVFPDIGRRLELHPCDLRPDRPRYRTSVRHVIPQPSEPRGVTAFPIGSPCTGWMPFASTTPGRTGRVQDRGPDCGRR